MRVGAKSDPDATLVLANFGLLLLLGEKLPGKGLTVAAIAARLKVPRSTVYDRVRSARPLLIAYGRRETRPDDDADAGALRDDDAA